MPAPNQWNSAKPPANWPDAPEDFSVSTLLNIESCPRRWALKNAQYTEVWDGKGYPVKPSIAALKGRIVHQTLEFIVRELRQAGSPALNDASAIHVMRRVGGYNKIIKDTSAKIFSSYENNPRAQDSINYLSQRLDTFLSEIRSFVQALLIQSDISLSKENQYTNYSKKSDKKITALTNGIYTEVNVSSNAKNWKGFIDLIDISDQHCAIKDYKTGQPKESDQFQIQTYAWLWYEDQARNPKKRIADQLTLIYPQGPVEVKPLTESMMQNFSHDIVTRSKEAKENILKNPPTVQLSLESCNHCNVRHLCNDYWKNLNDQNGIETNPIHYLDIQVNIKNRRGPKTWDAKVELSDTLPTDDKVILVIQDAQRLGEINDNTSIRILSCILENPTPEDISSPDLPLILVTKISEIFYL